MKRILAVAVLMVVACGQEEKTEPAPQSAPANPYGSVDEIKVYRSQIEPFIVAVSQTQASVDQRVGSAGRATVQNLAQAMQSARPQLVEARTQFAEVQPPAGLTQLHAKIDQLMSCRLEAYDLTIKGWESEQAGDPSSDWHAQAEAKLAEANQLIVELNDELQAVEAAVSEAAAHQLASP